MLIYLRVPRASTVLPVPAQARGLPSPAMAQAPISTPRAVSPCPRDAAPGPVFSSPQPDPAWPWTLSQDQPGSAWPRPYSPAWPWLMAKAAAVAHPRHTGVVCAWQVTQSGFPGVSHTAVMLLLTRGPWRSSTFLHGRNKVPSQVTQTIASAEVLLKRKKCKKWHFEIHLTPVLSGTALIFIFHDYQAIILIFFSDFRATTIQVKEPLYLCIWQRIGRVN